MAERERQVIRSDDVGVVPAEVLAGEQPDAAGTDTGVKEVIKTPGLLALKKDLEARKAALMEKIGPAREVYERKINDTELVEARRIIKENQKELGEVDNELAAIARALGAKGIRAEPGEYKNGE